MSFHHFAGALAPKKKSELQAIANALNISDGGTKDDLAIRIKAQLDTHTELAQYPQFAG